MAKFKDITLTNGMEIRVYRPPYTHIIAHMERKFPASQAPQPPSITEERVTGEDITMIIADDPDYLRAKEEWEQAQNEEQDMMGTVYALKDLEVPEDWDMMRDGGGAEMQYFDPDWKPREGPIGRKLDYIQWVVLVEIDDLLLFTNALSEVSGVDLEEVAANEASFQSQVEGETPQ